MNDGRWSEVKALFEAAVALVPAEREAFLSGAVRGDVELKAQVESLLRADSSDDAFARRLPFGLDSQAAAALESIARSDLADRDDVLLPTGSRIGPYDIIAPLGQGGMGRVFRARDSRLGRDVAIKVLPREVERDSAHLARFRREAQMLGSLSHPHIATLFGLEEANGRQALVMELVEGSTLRDRMTDAMPLREALDIAQQIAAALEAAHEKGIAHRDLKPANIKLTSEGAVKLLDFGIAKLIAGRGSDTSPSTDEHPTVTGMIIGTAGYMSPEQARGKPVDKRTDIWAFGCVLYEMLAGHPPFAGETLSDTIAAILDRTPDWTALPSETPSDVRRLLRRCLEKDPKQRLRDIGDARIELQSIAEAPVEDARPTPPITRAAPRFQLVAAAVLAAVTAGLVWVVVSRPAPVLENPLANARFTRLTDFSAAEDAGAISPDGRFVAFRSDRDGGSDLFVTQIGTSPVLNLTDGSYIVIQGGSGTRSVGFTADGSELWVGASLPSESGTQARLRIMPVLGGAARPFLGERVIHPSWSPDGRRLAYHTTDPGDPLFVAESTGANARQVFVNPMPDGHNHFPTYSPDGRWIYFVSGVGTTLKTDLWRIADSGGAPERMTYHNRNVTHPTPIAGDTVLYLSPESDGSGPWLWALDAERKTSTRVSVGIETYKSLHASADGNRLVATVSHPSAALWSLPITDDVSDESEVEPYTLPTVRALAPRFTGDSLFYLSSNGTADGLWLHNGGEAREIWKGASGALTGPVGVSPDGRWVTIVLQRAGKPRLHLLSNDGAELKPLAESIDAQGAASFSPEGAWIVTGGANAEGPGLFKIPVRGGEPVRLVAGPASNPVWSPRGDTIVFGGPTVGSSMPILAVHPDGTSLDWPDIRVELPGPRFRFTRDGAALVYLASNYGPFQMLDLERMQARPLTTELNSRAVMQTFDITPDGKRIVFDRLQDNSDIVLIELRPEG